MIACGREPGAACQGHDVWEDGRLVARDFHHVGGEVTVRALPFSRFGDVSAVNIKNRAVIGVADVSGIYMYAEPLPMARARKRKWRPR